MKGDFSSENEGRRAPILVNQWLGMPSDVRQYKWIFNREEIQQKCKILMTCIKQHVLLPLNPDIWVFGFGWKQTFRFLHIEGSVKPFMNSVKLQQRPLTKENPPSLRHDPAFVCNLCGDGKDLQTISPGGREREKIILSKKSLGKRRQSCLNEDGIPGAACLARRCG